MFLAFLFTQSFCQRTSTCTAKQTLFDLTESNYDQIIGGPRAVFVRMENQGCPYAVSSQNYWKEASDLFPNIIFVRAECIYNNGVCSKLGASVSPSHALFAPNSTKIAEEFTNPATISQSSSFYAQVIYRQLKFYPFDTATIDDLIPESTNKFFSSYKYPVFILYDSNCNEDSDFIAQWLMYATDEHISSDDYGFGKLDCSKYLDECKKWGATYPSANVFSRDKAISASITEVDHLADRVKSAIAFLDESQETYPTPAPYVPPLSTPVPVISNVRKITVDSLQNRDKDTIRSKYNAAKTRTNTGQDYTGEAEIFECKDVTLKSEVYTDVVKLINFYRELAGLPSDITVDESLKNSCYLAAKYSSRTATLSHDINDIFKKYCDFSENWEVIKSTLKNSNLANGREHVLDLVSGLIDDEGINNEGVVGHRRWLLYPYLKSVTAGFYPLSYHKMDGYSLQYPPSAVFGLNYGTYSVSEYTDVNFIAWPPAGPFPIERLPTSWSVYYSKFQNSEVTVNDIVVKLTRDDGQVLECSRIDLSKSTNGMPGTLVFKLTDRSYQLVTADHSVHAQIYLLKGETRDCLDYEIEFFDEQKEGKACFYDSDKNKCPSSISDENKYGKGTYSDYRPTGNSRTIIHVVDDIQPEKELLFDFSSTIIVKGNKIKGKVIVGVGTIVDIHDASETDVLIKTDPNNAISGVLKTPGTTKSVTVEFTSNPTSSTRFRILVYVGSYAGISYQKKIANGDFNYFFTATCNGYDTYIVCTPVSYVQYACQGGKLNEYNIDSGVNCYEFSEDYQLKSMVTNKKLIRVFCPGYEFTISASNLPNNFVDYEFLPSNNKINIVYSKALDHRARSITVRNYKGGKIKTAFSVSELGLATIDELEKVYPFTNLYLANLDESTNMNGYSIPNLLGDENAKEFMKTKQSEVYDESVTPFADENGYYQHKKEGFPLFITNGLHEKYIFNRTNDISSGSIRIKPTEETVTKPITISIAKQTDLNRRFENIFIQNYKDVTIEAEKHPIYFYGNLYTETYFKYIRLVNVSRVKLVDRAGQQVDSIETDITGTVNLDILTTPENKVTFNMMNFRTDNVVTATNCKCNTANIAESNPTIKNLQISNMFVFGDSKPKLENCTVNNIQFKLSTTDIFLPTLLLKNLLNVPSSIKARFEPTFGYSKKLKALADSPTLFIACLNTELLEQIKNKMTIVTGDAFGGEDTVNTNYKFVLSKDKKGVYFVKSSFDESKAPDTIPADVEYSISEENFNINPSPPPQQTPQATYPPQQTEQQTTTSPSSQPAQTEYIQTPCPTHSSVPVPTPIPDSIKTIELPEGSSDEFLDNELKKVFDENDITHNQFVIINSKEVNFNSELKDNQFIKPAEDSTINYKGGNLNLAIPGQVTVLLENEEESKLSFKGEGKININIKEDDEEGTKEINFNRKSQINGSVTLNVPSHVKKVSFESLNLESNSEIKVTRQNGEDVELTINNVNADYNTNAVLKDAKITNSLSIRQTAVLNLENVDLEDAMMKFEIIDYNKLNDAVLTGKFNTKSPKRIEIENSDLRLPTGDIDYTLVSGEFLENQCEEWLKKVQFGNSVFRGRKCLDNLVPLDNVENKRIVLHYSPNDEDGNGKGNKLSTGAIIGIVVGVVVAVAVIIAVVVFIFIRRKKKYEQSTEGADMEGIDKQDENNNNNNQDAASNEQTNNKEIEKPDEKL